MSLEPSSNNWRHSIRFRSTSYTGSSLPQELYSASVRFRGEWQVGALLTDRHTTHTCLVRHILAWLAEREMHFRHNLHTTHPYLTLPAMPGHEEDYGLTCLTVQLTLMRVGASSSKHSRGRGGVALCGSLVTKVRACWMSMSSAWSYSHNPNANADRGVKVTISNTIDYGTDWRKMVDSFSIVAHICL